MKKRTITIIDIITFLVNDLIAWFIVLWFEMTGYDNKFQNNTWHWSFLIIGIIHIIASTMCCVFFYKKERTKYKIQIGSKLFIYNEIMTVLPYLYLLLVWICF